MGDFLKDMRLMYLPIVLFVISCGILVMNLISTGSLFPTDVTLSGGISITFNIERQINVEDFENELVREFPQSSLNIRILQISEQESGIIVEDSNPDDQAGIIGLMEKRVGKLDTEHYSVETMGSSLGKSFFREMFVSLFFAFIFMGAVFFIYFKAWIPTGAAIMSAFFNIVITLGFIVALGIRLTSGGIAAFLMLIGYSIDTSILLTTKVVKGSKEHMDDSIADAMKTGLTMSAAGLAATGISFLLTNNNTLKQIMFILVVGLICDILTTWLLNSNLLKIYRKNVKN